MNYSIIPEEMRSVPNWVCWKSEPDPNSHSGIRKIPVNPMTGGNAQSDNPDTWSDFDTAVSRSFQYSGIGFMFTNSGFFGVDIDDCTEAITAYNNGESDNIVHEFIYGLCSYAELSQSGNGIHIICKGTLPVGARRKGKVEMYDRGRFFIMTGSICSEFADTVDCTKSIISLHNKYFGGGKSSSMPPQIPMTPSDMTEQEIISKAMMSQGGDKFASLYSGDISGYSSQSEADLAFCNLLAFWCGGNTTLMDSIFRKSGLMREKWDRKQSGSTYGTITLTRAAAGCKNFYDPRHSDNYRITVGNSPLPSEKIPMHTLDDTGNAQRMLDIFGTPLPMQYAISVLRLSMASASSPEMCGTGYVMWLTVS